MNNFFSDDEIILNELRDKARSHEASLPKYTGPTEFEALLQATEDTLDKIETELASIPTNQLDSECEFWMLGSSLSAVDIMLVSFQQISGITVVLFNLRNHNRFQIN